MKNTVALAKCDDYDFEKVYTALSETVRLCPLPPIEGKTVLLKPNILSAAVPSQAITTHPEFLRAAIRIVKEAGAKKIIVGDSPGVNNPVSAAKKSGLYQISVEEEVVWGDFSKSVEIKGGKMVPVFTVASEVEEADLVVSLPKFKTHQMMYYTGAMKNLFGVIQGLGKSKFHFRFPDKEHFASMIVDLNLSVKAGYTLMDGIIGMEGHGPGNGDPRKAGFVMASDNILAADLVGADIMGYDPMQIPILEIGLKTGTWLNNQNEINIKGESLESCRIKDWKKIEILGTTGFSEKIFPPKISRWINDFLVPKPVFNSKVCILCGKCVKICPASALEITKGKKDYVHIDYTKCIKCYCCHEVCPVDAISIKRRKPLVQGK